MKNLKKYTIVLAAFAITLMSCDSLLDVESERFLSPEQNQINSVNDTIYSMVGILSTLQPVATQYVLLGELRGDLIETTENARLSLQQISNFNTDKQNSIIDKRDYYEVIKHCNYLIHNIDTSIVLNTKKVMYKEYAAAKSIRAWVYMQLALNFGKVTYIEEPFLSIHDIKKDYPEYTFNELAPLLIDDLVPIKEIDPPGSISLGSKISTRNSFFPVKFVLGDLYLWQGEYENAAQSYYDLIQDENYIITESYKSIWEQDPTTGEWSITYNWNELYDFSSYETITQIASSTEFGDGAVLDTMAMLYYEITPSKIAINNWENSTYYHSRTITREGGDLRGKGASWMSFDGTKDEINLIVKYLMLSSNESKALPIYRISMLYLRYAEAVNRLGKPNLAFACIKNGLNQSSITADSIVPPQEKYLNYQDSTSALINYVQFFLTLPDKDKRDNIGIREHGSGNIDLVEDFKIPSLSTLADSIEYVEDLIMEENALEFAFEGNRYHDLMRVALRRKDESYLANKVAARFDATKRDEIISLLSNSENWYLK